MKFKIKDEAPDVIEFALTTDDYGDLKLSANGVTLLWIKHSNGELILHSDKRIRDMGFKVDNINRLA